MSAVLDYFRRLPSRQVVRPWALACPVVVLLIALPLLRPLRAPNDPSENELSRLASVQSWVERDTATINDSPFFTALRHADGAAVATGQSAVGRPDRADVSGTIHYAGKYYSDRPPVLSYLLSWPYALMYRLGWDFEHSPILVAYILTMLGATLPAALGAGLVYRMGRTFELKRPYRTALALIVALGSGLISYATALNPHAPAAALVLCACSCLLHVTNSRHPGRSGAWLMTAGFCAALAAVIDPSALIFLTLLTAVIVALRGGRTLRFGGLVVYAIGATPPIVLHAVLTVPITGDLRPGFLHPELGGGTRVAVVDAAANPADDVDDAQSTPRRAAWKVAAFATLDRSLGALVGGKGVFSHFPVALLGLAGIGLVLRRHWPAPTKVMAAATLLGGAAIITAYTLPRADWTQAMFGPRWFVVFLPLTLFWAGAWLRKSHHVATWAVAGVLLVFSVATSILGATAPFVRTAPGQYTVVAALRHLTEGERPATTTPTRTAQAVAGR
jgi:hypothetical protein